MKIFAFAAAAVCVVVCGTAVLFAAPAPGLAPVSAQALDVFGQKNFPQAAELFKQAASSGDATAELMLGYLYEQGKGVVKDKTQARQWYTLALTKTEQIARTAPSAKDEAFLRGVLAKAKAFVAAREQEEIEAEVPNVYTGDQYRDPFSPLEAGASEHRRKFTPADFSIHHLVLSGIMEDRGTGYALFVDPGFGVSFILRRGRLYDEKGKPVPGVRGTIGVQAKTAELVTSDQDVQPFRLGAK